MAKTPRMIVTARQTLAASVSMVLTLGTFVLNGEFSIVIVKGFQRCLEIARAIDEVVPDICKAD
jgi:hypothetical protein